MRYTFTGPVETVPGTREKILRVVMDLPPEYGMEFTSGAAYGVDSLAYSVAYQFWPDAQHRVCVPEGLWHNTLLVKIAEDRGHEVLYIPGGYMKRNDALISHCDVLLAFPESSTEVQRSGPWATIRRGRKANKDVRLFPLF